MQSGEGGRVCWLLQECSLWNKREATAQSGEWELVCVGCFTSAAFGTKEQEQLRSHVSGNWCIVLAASRAQPWEQRGEMHSQVSGNWGTVSVSSRVQPGEQRRNCSQESGDWCIVLAASRVQPLEQKREAAQSGEWELE